MINNKENKRLGYIFRFLAVLIWGTSPLIIKYSPASSIDLSIRMLLLFLGGVIASLLAISLLKKDKILLSYKLPVNKYLIIIMLLLIVLVFLVMKSLEYTSSTNFVLLNNFSPILALLIAYLFWRKEIIYFKSMVNISLMFLIFIMGSIGSSLLFYNDIISNNNGSLLGNYIAILFMVVDVVFVTSQIKYSKNILNSGSYFLTLYLYTASFFVMLLFVVFSFPVFKVLSSISIEQYVWSIGIGALWGMGTIFNYEAFRRMDGFIAFLMFNISIFITVVVEYFLLEEIILSKYFIIAIIFIIGASVFAEVINTKCEKNT